MGCYWGCTSSPVRCVVVWHVTQPPADSGPGVCECVCVCAHASVCADMHGDAVNLPEQVESPLKLCISVHVLTTNLLGTSPVFGSEEDTRNPTWISFVLLQRAERAYGGVSR